MSHKLLWISKPSPAIAKSIIEAAITTILIKKPSGPLSFVLHDVISQESHKVSLSECHQCDCVTFRKTQEPCVHICWLLLRKFKVDPQDELMFQKGLNENYMRSLFNKEKHHETKNLDERSRKTSILNRDDECPICFHKFFQSGKGITQCGTCFNHVHIPCRNLWKRNGDCDTKDQCPYCRGNFGSGLPVHSSVISWKKENSKNNNFEKENSRNFFLEKKIFLEISEKEISNFKQEFVKGFSLVEKEEKPAAPPGGQFPEWSTTFLCSSSSSSNFFEKEKSENELEISGRGLKQNNSTEKKLVQFSNHFCQSKTPIRPRRNAPNVLNKTVSAIRHNQQNGTKGSTNVIDFGKKNRPKFV